MISTKVIESLTKIFENCTTIRNFDKHFRDFVYYKENIVNTKLAILSLIILSLRFYSTKKFGQQNVLQTDGALNISTLSVKASRIWAEIFKGLGSKSSSNLGKSPPIFRFKVLEDFDRKPPRCRSNFS